MAELSTQAAKLGDSDDTLILKIAKAAQTWAGITNSTNIEAQTPQLGQTNSNLLRFAHAVQQL